MASHREGAFLDAARAARLFARSARWTSHSAPAARIVLRGRELAVLVTRCAPRLPHAAGYTNRQPCPGTPARSSCTEALPATAARAESWRWRCTPGGRKAREAPACRDRLAPRSPLARAAHQRSIPARLPRGLTESCRTPPPRLRCP